MPITYAAVVNARGAVVLQGTYKRGASYKANVQQYSKSFSLFATKEIFLDEKLKLVYKNMDQLTLTIITTQNVDLQESGAFLERFYNSIQGEILGKDAQLNGSIDLEMAARPLQAANAEQKYAYLTTDVNNFLETWNDNPLNRSKVSTLFKELEKTKDVMIEDVRISLERGQKVDQSLEKSENLVRTSQNYKRTSKQVERAFCARKWKLIAIAVGVLLILVLFIYLLIKI